MTLLLNWTLENAALDVYQRIWVGKDLEMNHGSDGLRMHVHQFDCCFGSFGRETLYFMFSLFLLGEGVIINTFFPIVIYIFRLKVTGFALRTQ